MTTIHAEIDAFVFVDEPDATTHRPARPRTRVRRFKDRCRVTNKTRYRDAEEATDALAEWKRRRAQADWDGATHTIRQQRKYRCEHCHGWHLTSWATPSGPGTLALAA